MILFHLPPFLVEGLEGLGGKGRVACHQIENAGTVVLVCEDLLYEQEREIDVFQPDRYRGVLFQGLFRHGYEPSMRRFGSLQGDLAVVLERHHELFMKRLFDEEHVLCRSEPGVVENITKQKTIADTGRKHLSIQLVLGLLCLPFLASGLLVGDEMGFLDQFEGDGQGDALAIVEATE